MKYGLVDPRPVTLAADVHETNRNSKFDVQLSFFRLCVP